MSLVPLVKPDGRVSRIRLSRQIHEPSYRGVVRDAVSSCNPKEPVM